MAPKPFSYAFPACAFHASLSGDILAKGEVQEGAFELIPFGKLGDERFCWGYDAIVGDYQREVIGETTTLPFRNDYPKCKITRLSPTADLADDWLAGGERWS
jgi:hypothetical protein